jgi:transcriptional regulator with XRE-family HTH domain
MGSVASSHPVARLRGALGLSQAAFASKIAVSRAYISRIEATGEGMGKDSALRVLAEFRADLAELRLTVEDLLRGADGDDAPTGRPIGEESAA